MIRQHGKKRASLVGGTRRRSFFEQQEGLVSGKGRMFFLVQ